MALCVTMSSVSRFVNYSSDGLTCSSVRYFLQFVHLRLSLLMEILSRQLLVLGRVLLGLSSYLLLPNLSLFSGKYSYMSSTVIPFAFVKGSWTFWEFKRHFFVLLALLSFSGWWSCLNSGELDTNLNLKLGLFELWSHVVLIMCSHSSSL